ncbi:MarR family winged helix-turn-helix transcriptional regulator [Micromonospora saelicesensis]|uniref:DNA-binding transcriptional regulator, MarR family n=1 Tax=Micromonospora saelicesensis TaxID=285676 RepID=A0A1C4W7A2_9ACTN|nr:MarR family winged helix-turn-helix transcriptional regulator [Micromonospora saelicesensis]SCE92096.1 DNA-binding transcriptional regulator, MarR family [Micromonospora saelicesensis]
MSDVPGAPADLLRSLTRAERLLSRRLGAVLADDAISIEAWRVLCLLADGQGHPMSEVSVEASLPPGTLTKLVDQLVDRNLVFRRIDPIDRRRIRAYLTARGRREHARLDERVRASIAELGIAGLGSTGLGSAGLDGAGLDSAGLGAAESSNPDVPPAADLLSQLDDLIGRLDPGRRQDPACRQDPARRDDPGRRQDPDRRDDRVDAGAAGGPHR